MEQVIGDEVLKDIAYDIRDALMKSFITQIIKYEKSMRKDILNDKFFSTIEGIINGLVFFAAAGAVHIHTSFLSGHENGIFESTIDDMFIESFNVHVEKIFQLYLKDYRESKKH